jgi:pimeloyl-ACP methyl ester carboxylesterase
MRSPFILAIAVLFSSCISAKEIPGRLVDVGGRKMHIVCVGEGAPTVVLESGMGESWETWSKVQHPIARNYRTCAYDRAGIGSSEPRKGRSIASLAEDLHAVLAAAGEKPPYVLVGHSLGGLIVRKFAAEHPAEVVGMVLVDSAHEEYRLRAPASALEESARTLKAQRAAFEKDRSEGTLRGNVAWWEARFEEWELPDVADAIPPDRRRIAAPLVVITAGRRAKPPSRSEEAHTALVALLEELQKEIASRSPKSEHWHSETGHYVHVDQPAIVIDAIRRVASQ